MKINEQSKNANVPPRTKGATFDADGQLVLLHRYRDEGNRQALETLVEQMMPWVSKVANRYAGRGFDRDDLLQVGSVGLLKAIERFDFSRGVHLTTFAEPSITGEIKRHFRDHGWLVRPPRNLQELNAKVMHAIDALTTELQSSPTVTAIAEYLAVSEEDVLEALHAGGGYNAEPLEPLRDDGSPGAVDLSVLSVDDAALERTELRQTIGGGLAKLNERDRQIIHMRFFQEFTQSEIAEHIGISQMHVSRIIRASLRTIRSGIDAELAG